MADVTVMGAGIFGLSIAWCCQSRGARVQVIDPGGPGAGASGGVVGALAPHVPENWNEKKAFQLESLLMAEAFWIEVEAAGGVSPGYARLGRLQPVPDLQALDLAQNRTRTAADLWQGRATWELRRDDGETWAPVTPTGWLIHDTLSARVHPRRGCAALAAGIRARGGLISTTGKPKGRIVWATGAAGLEVLSATRDRSVGGAVKGQAALLHFDACDKPQIFSDGVHVVPHADGTLAIGSTSEREFDDPATTDEQLDAVIEAAMSAVPVLHGARVIERWAGLRPRTRSRAPMLGEHPFRPDEFIANGGFKIGFGMAPKIGEVMAALVLDGIDDIPDGFRPATCL
ncbi:FAD-dependent oxidoreductase [Roseovarius sp. TE539]|uniref:NAD(P)/FAD-dependent oxidoreductase n=1 Tax=Roseovarius sp. TE539 TaxID=2249812 RepID=UPI000DE136E4|nr:FAD-dependent oxidoreductase [Roseovarius sp. TE539]RBI76004.1 FAD-dependent oxidoreductase [Roseovarius sp. TE539]